MYFRYIYLYTIYICDPTSLLLLLLFFWAQGTGLNRFSRFQLGHIFTLRIFGFMGGRLLNPRFVQITAHKSMLTFCLSHFCPLQYKFIFLYMCWLYSSARRRFSSFQSGPEHNVPKGERIENWEVRRKCGACRPYSLAVLSPPLSSSTALCSLQAICLVFSLGLASSIRPTSKALPYDFRTISLVKVFSRKYKFPGESFSEGCRKFHQVLV